LDSSARGCGVPRHTGLALVVGCRRDGCRLKAAPDAARHHAGAEGHQDRRVLIDAL